MTRGDPLGAQDPVGRPKGKRERRDVHGWLVLDKPVGMTSTHAVSAVKRLFQAKRAGHAGTLDPLASGILPIALGEGTKTVPFVMESRKTYVFTICWGEERDTDDAEGSVTTSSHERPSAESIRALLPRFTGLIEQVPPRFSAIKIAGERAYDIAREGEILELAPRPVQVHRLELLSMPDRNQAILSAECGKGAYVRALARDLGRSLGCYGHVAALRRTSVGPFQENDAVSFKVLQQQEQAGVHLACLLPVEAGLAGLPTLHVNSADAGRLARGQGVLLRGRDAPILRGWISVLAQGVLLALAEVDKGEVRPRRIFNLRRA